MPVEGPCEYSAAKVASGGLGWALPASVGIALAERAYLLLVRGLSASTVR